MAIENNEYYAELFTEMLDQDKERDALLLKIDDGISCKYNVPPELQTLPWTKGRKLSQTHLADAINAAIRPFASRVPRLSIQPLTESDDEYERVEMLKNAMDWELDRMNRYGEKSAHWQIVESAMRYNKVCIQTEYLPYKFDARKKDKRVKALLRSRNFSWNIHHPATIHSRFSDMGMEGVLKCCLMSAQALIDMFGKDNKGIKKMLKKMDEPGGSDLISTYFTYLDYTDWDNRIQAAVDCSGDSINRNFSDFEYEFRKEPHELDFIPWVVVDGGQPILQPVIESGMWENYLHMKTIEFAKGIELAAQNHLHIKTADGTLKSVYIDYTNLAQPIVSDLTTQITPLPSAPVDQNFSKVLNDIENNVYSSTTSRILADVGRFATSAMGTIQTIMQASLAQLSGSQYTIERAEALAVLQNFQWIDQSKISLVTFNSETTKPDVSYRQKGAQVVIKAGKKPVDSPVNFLYFDPEMLYLDVKVEPNSLTDTQAKLNEAIQMYKNMGASLEMVYDKFNLGNYDMHQVKRALEDLENAETDKEKGLILLDVQLKQMAAQAQIQQAVQQSQMQAQQQAQQQQAQQVQQSQGQSVQGQPVNPQAQTQALNKGGNYVSSQGMQTQFGGLTPQASAPLESRNTLNGTNQNGTPLA